VRKRITDTEEAEHLAYAAETTLRHLAAALFAVVGLVAFVDVAPVVVWSGAASGLLAALGGVGVVLLLLVVPFLCVLAASWAGVSLLVGAVQVMDLVERRAIARVEARVLRSRQGAVMVPAATPQGRGDEPFPTDQSARR
jgi:hypothetical protein